MKRAIILAAGRGSRLKGFFNKPKCLIQLDSSNRTLLERTYENLIKSKVNDIHIVTGYKSSEIKKSLKKDVKYIHFKNYRKTNNLQTLLFVKHLLDRQFVCMFADIIYEKKIIDRLLKSNKKICLIIDTSNVLEGTMRVKIKRDIIVDIGSHIPVSEGDGNFIGIAKFSKNGALMLKSYLLKQKNNYKDYYTFALRKMIADRIKINYIDIKKTFWKEIDTNKDFVEAKKKIKFIESK